MNIQPRPKKARPAGSQQTVFLMLIMTGKTCRENTNIRKMKQDELIRFGYWLGVRGVIQFIILTVVAMFVYPDGYSFSRYFFSTLGCVNSETNHLPSIASRILFIIACAITAVMNIPFRLALRTNLQDSRAEKFLAWLGAIRKYCFFPIPFAFSNLSG